MSSKLKHSQNILVHRCGQLHAHGTSQEFYYTYSTCMVENTMQCKYNEVPSSHTFQYNSNTKLIDQCSKCSEKLLFRKIIIKIG